MVFAWAIGVFLGIVTGIYVGARLFGKKNRVGSYSQYGIDADADPEVQPRVNAGKPIPADLTGILEMLPKWITWPDYEKTMWMNHAMQILWPYYNKAVAKMVIEQAKPQIDAAIKGYPFIEDVSLEVLDLGTKPIKVGGVKVYRVGDEEVIMEMQAIWGSNCRVRVSAQIKIAGFVIYVPVEVSNIQLKATARATLSPLVETIPCLGAVTITLMDLPYVELSLALLNSFDIMSLPLLHTAANFGLKMALAPLLLYPNKMTFPIMENGGAPPTPKGVLIVKVLRGDKLKGAEVLGKIDAYVQLSVRAGRTKKTRTINNTTNPEWNESMQFVVDDINSQNITIVVKDDEFGFADKILGVASIPLEDAKFMVNPRTHVPVSVDLLKPEAAGIANFGKGAIKGVGKLGATAGKTTLKVATLGMVGGKKEDKNASPAEKQQQAKHNRGTIHFDIMYVPFKHAAAEMEGKPEASDIPAQEQQPSQSKEQEPESKEKLQSRFTSTKITKEDKGVLTVTLIKASNLDEEEDEVDPFIELVLNDPTKPKPDVQTSAVVMNESNPRWGDKYDFINVSAASSLTVVVWDKESFLSSLLSLKTLVGKKPQNKKKLGTVRIPIKDVVRNKKIRDVWALQDAELGEVHLKLEWIPIELDAEDERLTSAAVTGIDANETLV
jgi:hypothetical protein